MDKEQWGECGAFRDAKFEEITLPRSLKSVGFGVFQSCSNLKKIYVEDGCEASISDLKMPVFVTVGPTITTMVGNTRVWDLKNLRQIIIPEGAEVIGNHWFWGCKVEEVVIPASVREIRTEAFCKCKELNRVIF